MSSARPERAWSLTRRLTVRFAILTSLLLALLAAGSCWALYSALQQEVHDFLRHESDEFLLEIAETDGSTAALQAAAAEIAAVAEEMPCAFRVTDAGGGIIAQAGDPAVLATAAEAAREDPAHRLSSLLFNAHHLYAVPIPGSALAGSPLQAELMIDATEYRQRLLSLFYGAGLWLALAVALAGFFGWLTASRGLAGLRDVVSQMKGIAEPAGVGIRLKNPPVELQGLGDEVNAMLERIEAGLREMQTFTAGLAHELRSPLQNLLGETEVALMAERRPEEYRALLSSHLEEFVDLSDAIDNLIVWCRTYKPAQATLLSERFDLVRAAELRLTRERRTATRANLEFHVEGEGDTTLSGDREGCLRVLRNLVANALACSPSGARVVVRIEGHP